jgi:hypothetical protein
MNPTTVISANAGQKRLRVERPKGRPEGRAKRVIHVFNYLDARIREHDELIRLSAWI